MQGDVQKKLEKDDIRRIKTGRMVQLLTKDRKKIPTISFLIAL